MTKAAFNLDPPSFEVVDPPPYEEGHTSATGDYCNVCGTPLVYAGKGRHPKFCDEHKPQGAKGTSTPRGSKGKDKGATQAEWTSFNTTALIVITWLIGRFAAGGQGLFLKAPPGMTEQTLTANTDYLSMDGAEAGPIAKLLAARITPTNFNKKVGRYVTHALDYEDVGYALWGYGKRVGPVLARRISSPKGTPIQPIIKESASNGVTREITNIEAAKLFRQNQPTGTPNPG